MSISRIRQNRFKLPLWALWALCIATMLAGCASGPPAPVEDLTIPDTNPTVARNASANQAEEASADVYRVAAGDTLYSIAFRRGLDYRDLARWNDIARPYTIFVGELLHLKPQSASAAQPLPGQAVTEAVPDRPAPTRTTPPTSTPSTPSPPKSVASPPTPAHLPPPGASAVAQKASAPVLPEPGEERKPVAAKPGTPAKPVAELKAGGVVWRWPADGKVIATFADGDQARQGIDIAGNAGDPVRAAASGVVVYSGNGLIGYGELIIIKHNANYLSAYAHNRKRLVKEGERVQAGKIIAELGSTASSRDELHFEIRKNGKPVNPLDYLPAR